MSPVTLVVGAAVASAVAGAVPTDSFLAPLVGKTAANATLQSLTASSPDQCAQSCLLLAGCLSFNYCTGSGSSNNCDLSGWNVAYTPVDTSSSCSLYQRIRPRNDGPVTQAVPWLLQVPTGNVSVRSGPLSAGFYGNLNNYLLVRDPLDMLFFFAKRAGVSNPAGQCFGWDEWIKGSATGNYLMGAGGALRFADSPLLRANVQSVVDGIKLYGEPDGWLWVSNNQCTR